MQSVITELSKYSTICYKNYAPSPCPLSFPPSFLTPKGASCLLYFHVSFRDVCGLVAGGICIIPSVTNEKM